MIRRRQWLIIALCFCALTGCVSCQNNYDYCGPMPEEGGDFMYRKNSILGGDPAMPRADESTGQQDQEAGETQNGPEPTPAPPHDEMPAPGMDEPDEQSDLAPDGESQSYEELDQNADDEVEADSDAEEVVPASGERDAAEDRPISTLQWHAPTKKQKDSPIQQVRFR